MPSHDPEGFDWRAGARCATLPPTAVFSRRPIDAAPALRACNTCPVVEFCLRAVDPANTWFDGVCGGRLWSNGREVPLS
ncbi:WhiB family transcriptional regulator [Streptomyces sp. bgisy100]|uniref:WhiB family transcriptional regulator n=1 Tax=Streptomyces sp. bgisy100 TaxID=3413783 RepID=UPI003D7038B7